MFFALQSYCCSATSYCTLPPTTVDVICAIALCSHQKRLPARAHGMYVCPCAHFFSSPRCVKTADRVKGDMDWAVTLVMQYYHSMCVLENIYIAGTMLDCMHVSLYTCTFPAH